jgi:hypothetical protein
MATRVPASLLPTIRLAVAGPLAGCWLSSILFGVELLCFALYASQPNNDKLFVRCSVLLSALLSIANQVNQFAYVFTGAVMAWAK